MNYRSLGRTGLRVSEIGFGAWAIGGNMWGPTDDRESIAAIRRGLDLGVNFIDTADVYGLGHSEDLMAEAISGRREQLIIATKVGNDFHNDPRPWSERRPPWVKNFTAKYLREGAERSLARLRTDFMDVYQLHNPPRDVLESGEVFETLDALKQEGKIRFYGVSIGPSAEGILCLENGKPDCLQVVYN